MSTADWLTPLRRALDDAPAPVTAFVRDDDGGWDDARLGALLDVCAASGMPVDVALIPAAVGPRLALELRARTRSMRLGLHQHGYTHADHQPAGRKCEFGSARSESQMHADVAAGQAALKELLGDMLEPVFTPPWNRCVPALGPVLSACGVRVLSRDLSAGRLDQPGLIEVPVSVDWFGGRKGVRWTREELGAALAVAVRGAAPLGLMLHHAVTDADELADISALLALLAGHERVRPASILDVADDQGVEVAKAESAILR